MDKSIVKKSVVEGYGNLAKSVQGSTLSKLFGCCDLTQNAKTVGVEIGYSQKELEAVPDNSNLGVGCGNPSSYAQIKEGDTVVDLGSGAGFDAFIVSPVVGASGKVIGVDLSDEMIGLANKNANQGSFKNVEFIKGDIESLPLQSEIAEHVISNCVINLSLNKADVYKEAHRILKKGGRLSISDVVLEQELPDYIQKSLAGHLACISGAEKLEDYLDYVRQAGFKDVKIEKESAFPLELMLADPQLRKMANELDFNVDSEEAKNLASRVKSISLTATK